MRREWRFSAVEVRAAISASMSFAETLRRLELCPSGGNWKTLRRYAEDRGISTAHFDPYASSRGPRPRIPLEEILVRDSSYSRNHLKERLYEAGLKRPICEMCGQGPEWQGRRLGLILDHVNGVRDDNRIENLRIVCPNCAATLETHCGRKNRLAPRRCSRCGAEYQPRYARQQYCSRACGIRHPRTSGLRPSAWKVPRPPYDDLLREIAAHGWSAVGRKYGVSDNAVRKWVRAYERWPSQG
jgi:HNH endonuclease